MTIASQKEENDTCTETTLGTHKNQRGALYPINIEDIQRPIHQDTTAPLLITYFYLFGIIESILPAKSLKFCVCKITFPGPTNFVKNKPSPPKKMFPKPFTVSIS